MPVADEIHEPGNLPGFAFLILDNDFPVIHPVVVKPGFSIPQGLKPNSLYAVFGTTEVVPVQNG